MLTNNSQSIAIKDLVDVSNINRCLPSFYPPHHCEKYSVFSKWCWQESKYGSIFSSLPTSCSITNSAFSCWEWAFFGSHRILRVRQMYLCVTSASLACWKKCAHWDRTNWKPVTFHILVVQTLKLYVKNSIVSTKLYICIAIFSYYLLSRKHFGRMLLVQTLI